MPLNSSHFASMHIYGVFAYEQAATGATGAAGATILGSYPTLADLVAAHPTGTVGDAYLAGGVLYVWNGTAWQSMGSLVGPTGAAGTTILGSYPTLADLEAAHPTGTVGDAYLAGGVLYVWNGTAWESMGSLVGPTGATGAAGATILDSYPTLADLVAAHPTGTVGDAYLAGGELYVWNGTEWESMGSLVGPTGAAGATILDSYDTLQDLINAHPTGTIGDAYLVDGVLYVWDGTEWKEIGSILGPTGATGATGTAELAATIIPFASQQAPLVHTNAAGEASDVALIGFGYMDYAGGIPDVGITIDTNDGSFTLSGTTTNRQVVFSLPFDMTINSVYATMGNYEAFPIPIAGSLVYPYVQIYAAPAATNVFFPLEGAIAKAEIGINPVGAQAATMRSASATGLEINLEAGTRIAIGGLMEITGDTAARDYYLYYTGGIGMTRWIRE